MLTRALRALLSGLLLVAPAAGGMRQKAAQPTADAATELAEGRKLLRRGDAARALVRLEEARRLFAQAGKRSGLAAANDLLGELYERQGRYDVALGHFRQALEASRAGAREKRKGDAYNYNLLLAKVGHMLVRQNEDAQARDFYTKMDGRKLDRSALGQLKRKGLMGAASGILGGSDNAALEMNVSAAAGLLAAKSEYDFYRHAAIYSDRELGLGRLEFKAGNYAEARQHFENVVEATDSGLPFIGALGRSRRYRAVALSNLGDTALAEGEWEDAVESYKRAAKEAREAKRPDLAWPAQRGLGKAQSLLAAREKKPERARKRRQEALEAYRAAAASVETLWEGGVRADEARADFLATTRAVYEEAAGLLAELALEASTPDQPLRGEALQQAEEAFRFAEAGRARSLLDLLGEAGARVEGGVPEQDREARRLNLERQQEVAHLLTGLRFSTDAPEGKEEKDVDIEKLEKEADDLQLAYEKIENRIRTENPRYGELTSAQPLALAEVRSQLLADGTALVAYSLGAERSYLWAATADGVTLRRLPARAEIDRQVEELRVQILPPKLRRPLLARTDEEAQRGLRVAPSATVGDPAAFARASWQLYRTVFEPAAAFVGARRLLIVPEGSLSYVPFEALVGAEGGADYAALPYLVKTNEVVYAPSASVAAALRRQATGRSTSSTVLVVADPVFDRGDPRAPKSEAAAAPALSPALASAARDLNDEQAGPTLRFVRLDGTRAEADEIARLANQAGLKAEVWLGLDASETNAATRDLSRYRVLHFATHGLLDTERPQFTGLVLSLVGDGGSDGYLRTGEVFNLRLGSPLVMLSACETGLGRERRGEGVIGLTRAFMYAGAPSVGVTLWSVGDRATADLMADFYRRLFAPENPPASAALRQARLRFIEERKYSAPFHWAAFVLVGDWR